MTNGMIGRRQLLAGVAGLGLAGGPLERLAAQAVDLRLPGGPSLRPLTRDFPEKGEMILQRGRPPLLETPFEVFDQGIFTPNDRFFVRWHWGDFPTEIDPAAFRLKVHGHVARPVELSLAELLAMPALEYAAVNQCAGNSRGLFVPRVPGAQWRHGAMGNALWTGVALRDVLSRAGVLPGAVAVRFAGLDEPAVPDAPRFVKSLAIDHAMDGEVMIAHAQNGARLPLLNGYPLRLVVPGWYSTYWIKMLSDIEVLDRADDGYWMAKAYRIPANATGDAVPGAPPGETVPITRMVTRSWITSHQHGARIAAGQPVAVGGIAMGGDQGVARVELSRDGGASWQEARLGRDAGRYSFRRFDADLPPLPPGPLSLLVRATNTGGEVQPLAPNWNGAGYMRGVVERLDLIVG